jgi:nucleotide-binding universal stress UspA family protein
MKAVLCALDFKEASDNVIKAALELAEQKQETLVILYAYRLLMPKNQDIGDFRNAMELRARTEFDTIIRKLNVEKETHYEFRAEIGFFSDRIDAYLKSNPVDTIVMGQHLAQAIHENSGMTFEYFLESTKVPVLVVPEVSTAA